MSRRRQAGQAVAELAVVLPIMLLLLLATIGFGHWVFVKITVLSSANRAARYGAVLYGDSTVPKDEAYRKTRAAALGALNSGLGAGERTVLIQQNGDDLHVTVRFRYRVFVPFVRPWLGEWMQEESEVIYLIERDTT